LGSRGRVIHGNDARSESQAARNSAA
jgi:hypothetical protein